MSIRRIAFNLTRLILGCGAVAALALVSAAVLAPSALENGWGYAKHLLRAPHSGVLAIAAGDQFDSTFRVANTLKESLETGGGFAVAVLSSDGAGENLKRVQRREAQFATLQSGMRGVPSEMTAVATLGRQYLHVIVPKESSIHEMRDLAGKRVSVGPAGGAGAALAEQILEFYVLSPSASLLQTPVGDIQGGLDGGQYDAAMIVCDLYGAPAAGLLASGRYRLIPLPEAEAIARRVSGVFADRIATSAYGTQWTLPVSGAGGMPTVAVNTLLATPRGENGYVVWRVLETLYSAAVIQGANLVGFTEAYGREGAGIPLHPAANRFYHRNDPVTIERFEVASLFVAALLGVVCLFAAITRRATRRRLAQQRARIVRHFDEMYAYADRTESVNDSESLTEILRQMTASHRRAEKEWLAGYLNTEDMENLNAIFQIRSSNTFDKMTKNQVHKLREQCARIYALMANYLRREREGAPAAAPPSASRAESAPGARPASAPPPKPEPPKGAPARVTAKDEDIEEGLPEILLPPDEPAAR